MKVGRKLDVLVAKEVMGWSNIIRDPSSQDFFGEPNPKKQEVQRVPLYSIDTTEAQKIIDKMIHDGWKMSGSSFELVRKFEQKSPKGDENSVVGPPAESPAHAICLAALKAKGIELANE